MARPRFIHNAFHAIAAAAAAAATAAPAQAGECEPHWAPGFGLDQNAAIRALAVIEGPDGPTLYASGSASAVFHRPPGQDWQPLTGGGIIAEVRALAVFDDGSGPALYATPEGGLIPEGAVKGVTRWNGQQWQNLGSGLGGTSLGLCLEVFDDGAGPALYVGGSFQAAGDQPATSIARWDGDAWSPVGAITTPGIHELAVFDNGTGPALYAGGNAITVNASTSNIARWDGKAWSTLPPAPTGPVRALAVHDDGSGPALYAAGLAPIAAPPVVARFNGQTWTTIGEPFNGNVDDLISFDDASGNGPSLYAAGTFTGQSGDALTIPRIARWTGRDWQTLDGGTSGTVHTLASVELPTGPALLVGGFFSAAGQLPSKSVALWQGCPTAPCPADLNNSGDIDSADLNILLADFSCNAADCPGDIDGDADTDSADLNALLAEFAHPCD